MRTLLLLLSVFAAAGCNSADPDPPADTSDVWIAEATDGIRPGLIFSAPDFLEPLAPGDVLYTQEASCLDPVITTLFSLESEDGDTRLYRTGERTLELQVSSSTIVARLDGGPAVRFVRFPMPLFGC